MSTKPYDRDFAPTSQSNAHDRPAPAGHAPEVPPRFSPKRTRQPALVTSTPETAPHLLCPSCDHPLEYRRTIIGGVKPIEQWLYFVCPTCGEFVYRHRTRQLRPAKS
jgi:predicted RNA-binding Zn-ribbon protein involved in translation (DUF1610 family)